MDEAGSAHHALRSRLDAAGVEATADPLVAWQGLRDVEGGRATIIDLYELVAARRGLAAHELPLPERMSLARSAMQLVWPGFDITSASDRPTELIEVVDYDARWPLLFESWRNRIMATLREVALAVEHVGSTAVPGLPAKPIVDVQVSVADLADESRYVQQLEALGVQLRSRDDLHRYFRPFRGSPREVHVHVCAAGGEWEREHLLFRNYLRTHPDARDAYGRVKRAAARTWRDDRWAYTDAKSETILNILEAAEQWAAQRARSEQCK